MKKRNYLQSFNLFNKNAKNQEKTQKKSGVSFFHLIIILRESICQINVTFYLSLMKGLHLKGNL